MNYAVHVCATREESQAFLARARDTGAAVDWSGETATKDDVTTRILRTCRARSPWLYEHAVVTSGQCPEHADESGCRALHAAIMSRCAA